MLQRASEINSNNKMSPKEQVLARRSKAKEASEDIVSYTIEHGLSDASDHSGYSETAIAKMVIKSYKKDDISIDTLLPYDRVSAIEEYLVSQNS